MYSHAKAAFVLKEISIRGIGPYIHGARLPIKPLTIICGENGSGKSTWLKALNVLRNSLDAGALPYRFVESDERDHSITNAYLQEVMTTDIDLSDTPPDDSHFGPPGTIGLLIESSATPPSHTVGVYAPHSDETAFLWNGGEAPAVPIRIQLAHPRSAYKDADNPSVLHWIQLAIGKTTVRLVGPLDRNEVSHANRSRPSCTIPYRLYCSRSLVDTSSDSSDLVEVATVNTFLPSLEIAIAPQCRSLCTAQTITGLVAALEDRIRGLVRDVVDGFFYIEAVRTSDPTHDRAARAGSAAPKDARDPDVFDKRYVGGKGENAWKCEFHFDQSRMMLVERPHFLAADFDLLSLQKRIMAMEALPRRLAYIVSRPAGEPVKKAIEAVRCLAASDDSESGTASRGENFILAANALAMALNRLIDDREFASARVFGEMTIDPEDLPDDYEGVPFDEMFEYPEFFYFDDEYVRFMMVGPEPSNKETDIPWLNYILLCETLLFDLPGTLIGFRICWFVDYISTWLTRLFGIELKLTRLPTPTEGPPWSDFEPREQLAGDPAPYLVFHDPTGADPREEYWWMTRLSHPCFGSWGSRRGPDSMSAGLHQVFPLLVQLGMMKRGELLGIENPEVHLHPSLQMRVAEMLIAHAKSGRNILVETHSDLVIRRTIRAILEEEMSQSQVDIYFTELVARQECLGQKWFSGSRIERIRIDEEGRIANWPTGFLDEDVRESERLLDVMYGARRKQSTGEDVLGDDSDAGF